MTGALRSLAPAIDAATSLLLDTLGADGRVLAAGNGGSAAEAMHLAEELSGRYRGDRRAFDALALPADGTALTCMANDFGFEHVFARGVEAFGRKGDLLVVLSSSGNSANLARACETARRRGLRILALLGGGGGALAGKADAEVVLPADVAPQHAQEAHLVVIHLMLDAVERAFTATAGRNPAHAEQPKGAPQ